MPQPSVVHRIRLTSATSLVWGVAAFFGVPLRASAQFAPSDSGVERAKPFEGTTSAPRSLRDSLVQLARTQIGHRYRIGGQTPKTGFDCSGLVRYVFAGVDVEMPRTARQQAAVGLSLPRDTSLLLPGDLLTFAKSKKGVSHIAIYTGTGHYIHASKRAGKVIETSLIDRPHSSLTRIWHGARRIPSLDDSPNVAAAASTSKTGIER